MPRRACLFSIDTSINNGTTTPGTNGYTDQMNPNLGTSFSSPIVAGIAGLMTSVNGNLKPAQLIARLKEGAKAFPVSSDTTVPNCHVPASSTDLQTADVTALRVPAVPAWRNAPGAIKAATAAHCSHRVPAAVSAGQTSRWRNRQCGCCNHTISTYAWTNVGPLQIPFRGPIRRLQRVVAPATRLDYPRLTVTDDAGRQDTADVVVSATSATTTAPANAIVASVPLRRSLSP